MAIPTEQLLGLLRRGYTITTFYRLSAKAAFQSSVRIPEGYLLLSQNGEEEGVLTHIEFQSIKHLLIEHDIWEEVIGSTLYGGSSWSLKANMLPFSVKSSKNINSFGLFPLGSSMKLTSK